MEKYWAEGNKTWPWHLLLFDILLFTCSLKPTFIKLTFKNKESKPSISRNSMKKSLESLDTSTTGVSNIRPAGQKRPVVRLNPACGMIL